MDTRPVNIRRITLIALMSALIFVLTAVPRVPIPATSGYIHLGDAGIIFAACAFGPWVGMVAGAVGTALADLVGYPQWAIFSFIIHGLQGLFVGLIMRRGIKVLPVLVATVVSLVVVAGGYFVVGALLQGPAVAVVEIIPNLIQALSGSVVGIPLILAVRKAYPPLGHLDDVN